MTGIILPRLALRMTIVRGLTILNPFASAGIGSSYSHILRLFGGTAPYTFELRSALPGGWDFDEATGTLSNPSPDSAGQFQITIYVHDANWDNETEQTFTINVVALPLVITNSFSSYTAGVSQSFDYTTTGGAAGAKTFVVTSGSLPPGLSLSSAGHISGNTTGLSVGTHSYTFGVTATDSASTVSVEQVQTVVVTVVALSINNSAPAGTQGAAYSFTYAKSGGTGSVTWTKQSGTLPPGLSLSSAGMLSGTPTANGSYSFVVAVTDAAGTVATRSESVSIAYPTLVLSGAYATGVAVLSAYSSDLGIVGGDGAYSNARVTSGSLPAGLALSIVNVSGSYKLRLSGMPSAIASSSFTVAVDSGDGQTASASQTVVITTNATAVSIYNKIAGWWELDEASGTVVNDSHTNSLNGTSTAATVNQTGLAGNLGKSYSFASGNPTIRISSASALNITGAVSVMSWAKRNGAQGQYPKLLWKSGVNDPLGYANYMLQQDNVSNGGKVVFRVTSASPAYADLLTTSAMADATVYQYIGTRNGTSMKMYVNGALNNSSTSGPSGNLSTGSGPLAIGNLLSANDNFIGSVDQFAVFSGELTSTEVTMLYGGGSGISYATLKFMAGH